MLKFSNGKWVGNARVSISGTVANCAGGPTPWATWITCEEGTDDGEQPHGFPFECTIKRVKNPEPIKAMGRFKHEAIAMDPRTGFVFETEDNSSDGTGDPDGRNRGRSSFYCYVPRKRLGGVGSLDNGRLYVAQVLDRKGNPIPDLRKVEPGDCGRSWRVRWIRISKADAVAAPVGGASSPYLAGQKEGATRFQRLEGAWWDPAKKRVVFNDTEGGPGLVREGRGEGAVWAYDPRRQRLKLLFVSADVTAADNPDNITVNPDGKIFLCEDGGRDGDGLGLSLLGLLPNGKVFEFGRNNIKLTADQLSAAGKDVEAILGAEKERDFTGQEWAGATFSPDGKWLFVNIQTPGITFAITGPWKKEKRGRRR